ncbi:hypothetical protein BP6252_11445 [Coleophoma cylindrospora]|uniref:Myosin class II heavy chain n=1 Tax=Coleophoma cylindrospora TaxID=1849047 RepID=A0A3D8QJM1_9HELO|nr:hypothetical protein BP6252_11445 [Coleophoma cylindrospora]
MRLEVNLAGVQYPVIISTTITSSLPPSSPPPAAAAQDGSHRQDPQSPRSPAFSTSSTADDVGSSPVLPPLPPPSFNGRSDLLRTPPRSEVGSQYYTASWGSPYQQPTGSQRARTRSPSRSLSSDPSVDSPIRHLEFHTPYLRPVPAPRSHSDFGDSSSHYGVSASVLAARARRPAQGLTEDWIRQHTVGESTEGHNWLSDDPGESEHSSLSGSISGENLDPMQETDPRTPTLKSFLGKSEQARFDRIQALSGLLKKKSSTETLKQSDYSQAPIPRMELDGAEMDLLSSPSRVNQRPPPPPPKDEAPEWRAAAMPVPFNPPVPTLSPAPAPPRLKKKVPWKGKNIMVLLPLDEERGKRGKAPTPMREKDVVAMLKDWEQLGYDTTGFNISHDHDTEVGYEGQSRSVWPNAEDVLQERAQRSFRVSIPNRSEWDAYVRELSEAKLRALGVTLGDEEPAVPPPPPISRRMSTQYPQLPFSPPIPPSSGASSRGNNPFSPPLIPGIGIPASQSSINGSIASPASMQSFSQAKFNPRASVSFSSGAHPFGSPFEFGQQSPSFSPGHMLNQSISFARGGSPNLQNLGAMISPSSPFQEGYFPGDNTLAQLQQRQQQLQAQINQQQIQMRSSANPSPRLQELREADDEEATQLAKSPSKTPEARVNGHNSSASLQKEIDDAEYHLEEQFQRQLEHEDYSPHSDREGQQLSHRRNKSSVENIGGLASSRYAEDTNGPILHHPQPHSRGHSLSQQPYQEGDGSSSDAASKDVLRGLKSADNVLNFSDADTNPSNMGTPVPMSGFSSHDRNFSTISNPWVDADSQGSKPQGPRHGSKPSMSTLNVEAKEFKFEPSKATFTPGQFSFTGATFSPSAANFAPNVPLSATSSHFSHRSTGSRINVEAPAFTPGHSEFNFSTSGPSFRADAPAFTPYGGNFSDSIGSGNEAPVPGSIFGNIDLSHIGIVKPSKKSKAITIVRPDSGPKEDDEVMEGKDGRITQGEGRIKRARGGKDDGDSVPLFAEPSMPLGETLRGQSPPKEFQSAGLTQADKENSEPVPSEDETLPDTSLQFPKPEPFNEGSEEVKDFVPFEFHQQKQAEDFNAARPFTSKRYSGGLQPYGFPASPEQNKAAPEEPKAERPKTHRKNTSSLSATAKPFEFRPGAFTFSTEPQKPLPEAPVFVPSAGLLSSRYAKSPTPSRGESPEVQLEPEEISQFQDSLPGPASPHNLAREATPDHEPTFEEIDAVMRQLNEVENDNASRQVDSSPRWQQSSPNRLLPVQDLADSSPIRLAPQNLMRSDAPSPSPARFRALPDMGANVFARAQDDVFVGESATNLTFDSPIHHLNTTGSVAASDWDDVISEAEEAKLQPRAGFFDSHVNEIVGGILEERLDPLEKALESIQMSLEMMANRAPSRRRDARSLSGELPSDADDEDDEFPPRRSMSPRRDRKMEKIRTIVTEALASHQLSSRPQSSAAPSVVPENNSHVLRVLEEMKESFGASLRLDLRGEDLRNVVEQAVEARMPQQPPVDELALAKAAEDKSRISDLEEILRRADLKIEDQIKERRAAEDRLAEVQRLLRISSEEEIRLREALDDRDDKIRVISEERDQKVRDAEDARVEITMRNVHLEAAQEHSLKTQSDLHSRLAIAEDDLHDANEKVQRWQIEAERALEAAKRHSDDAEQANETNRDLRRTIETLRTQMEESIRVREGMRGKLMGLQEDMANAARNIAEENARRAKREAELVARQEVLDAKLQAEARTRERLEMEIERLETGERDGMRAVNECKKLELLVSELRQENHVAQQDAMKFKREYEEARESGLSEVQRTKYYMQAEIEAANNQVNVARDDLETQLARARVEVDQVKLDADTTKAKYEMLLEEVNSSKIAVLEDLTNKHANEVEDIHTQHERQLSNAVEDAQRSEQHLLERLTLSSAKNDHLQDRVQHLEEKLEVAKAAAHAAANAARSERSVSGGSYQTAVSAAPIQLEVPKQARDPRLELPEKISPQALRESIMVLQEQLQDREKKIEELEQNLSTVDLDAPNKITKRDDEIMWLRELLAVRKGDVQDIVNTLSNDDFDPETVKDAAIRLNANLQMEEQERERAMNGGSALNLPNIAASLAASPRVAQAVGPLAAAWGNWRKNRDSVSEVAGSSATPAKNTPGSQGFLSGLLTPPASARTPPGSQPTAFRRTNQRFSAEQLANRPKSMTPRQQGKMPMRGSPKRGPPATPPMMRKSSYDMDATAASGSDFGFDVDEDDDSVVDYR